MASNLVVMASNQVAMASNLVAMASNLVAMDGLQPSSDGLQPSSDGLQPRRGGLQPSSFLLLVASCGTKNWTTLLPASVKTEAEDHAGLFPRGLMKATNGNSPFMQVNQVIGEEGSLRRSPDVPIAAKVDLRNINKGARSRST